MNRVGILTGGGDCPGLNAVIRAVVRRGVADDVSVLGFRNGWAGVHGRPDACELDARQHSRAPSPRRHDPRHLPHQPVQARTAAPSGSPRPCDDHGVDALIAVGGEDTLGVARRLGEHGIDVVGVPKTIDNDLAGTDFTFGFHTAVQIATDAIDRLHTTAESHNRVMVVEVMGRHAGWIAIYSGMAGGADAILVPERPFDVDEVCDRIRRRHDAGRTFSIVVVAEGATRKDGARVAAPATGTDAFGHARLGGIAVELERDIEERTGYESRMTILGHVQRGGTPTAFDRVLATRFGVAAVDAVMRRRVRPDGRAARHGDHARAARRGAARAQAARPRPVRDRRGVLRMSVDGAAAHQDRRHDRARRATTPRSSPG